MSNILAKDRKPPRDDLVVLNRIEEHIKDLSSIVSNQNKIPKRRKSVAGDPILVDITNAYCHARNANWLRIDGTKEERNHRKTELYKAEECMNNVVSRLRILPALVPSISHQDNWLNKQLSEVVITAKMTNAWRVSDEKRINEANKLEHKSSINKNENNLKVVS